MSRFWRFRPCAWCRRRPRIRGLSICKACRKALDPLPAMRRALAKTPTPTK